jgi:hypothetical protein
MSASDLLLRTGLNMSTRQFRRYLASGIVPGVVRRKGGHFAVVGPITPKRIATIKDLILKFQLAAGRKRLGYLPPVHDKRRGLTDVRFSRLNLARIIIEFGWWMNQCEPLKMWTDTKKREVLRELVPACAVGIRLASELKEQIPEWNGTKEQLRALRA